MYLMLFLHFLAFSDMFSNSVGLTHFDSIGTHFPTDCLSNTSYGHEILPCFGHVTASIVPLNPALEQVAWPLCGCDYFTAVVSNLKQTLTGLLLPSTVEGKTLCRIGSHCGR